jgi:hypothetical protein
MNWKFLKTNWFYLALGFLAICYGIRKFPQLNPFHQPDAKGKIKLSDGQSEAKRGAALLGFVPDIADKQSPDAEEITQAYAEAFLKRFASVAVSERKKFGIPVSVILAAAYVNSKAGKNEAATKANNYFALSCANDWEGETAQISGSCLREYESAWASFRDFSIYLSSQEWFGALKKSAGKDWRKWAKKLGEENISRTDKMLSIIEQFDLQELD